VGLGRVGRVGGAERGGDKGWGDVWGGDGTKGVERGGVRVGEG
jgi:hypothetical protein